MHHCALSEAQVGICKARANINGKISCINYGEISSIALDPIEKKPLRLFHPNSRILSIGSFGCNLACPFCQNYEISQKNESECKTKYMSPADICEKAFDTKIDGNIGIAYTYNEPLVGWEFVRDTAKLIHNIGMYNVIVTNGSVLPNVLDEILPYIDAMNIDLKCFTTEGYKKLGGDLQTVKDAIIKCAKRTHVELTTLIVPGFNDSESEIDSLSAWIASIDKNIALHITRFFPRYKMENVAPTEIGSVLSLSDIAKTHLKNVFPGNI